MADGEVYLSEVHRNAAELAAQSKVEQTGGGDARVDTGDDTVDKAVKGVQEHRAGALLGHGEQRSSSKGGAAAQARDTVDARDTLPAGGAVDLSELD